MERIRQFNGSFLGFVLAFLGIGLGKTQRFYQTVCNAMFTERNGGFHGKNMEKSSINVLLGGSSHLVSGL